MESERVIGESVDRLSPLPGQFCVHQLVSVEQPGVNLCFMNIMKGYGPVCPFVSTEHAQQGRAFLGLPPIESADGVCRDFEPLTEDAGSHS